MAGILISSFSLTYGVMQIPSGFLSVTLGPRRTIMTFTVFSLLGVSLFYLGQTFEMLIIAQILIGLGFSVFYINAINLVSQWFPPKRRTSAIGILSASSGLGNFASYIGFPLSVTFAGGWRLLYLYCIIILLVNFVANFFIIRNSPDEGSSYSKPSNGPNRRSIVELLGRREIYPILVGYVLACFSWIFLSWLPKLLVDTVGMSYLEAGLVSSMATIAGIPGCIAVAVISDRLKSRKLPLIVFSLCYTIILTIFLFLPRGTPLIFNAIIATALGFATSLWVLSFSMIPEVLPRDMAGMGLGLMNALGTLGFTLFTPIYGALIDVFGSYVFSNALILLGAASMTAIYIIFMRETYGGLKKAD